MIGRVTELHGKAAYIGIVKTDGGLLFDLKVSDLPGMKNIIRVGSIVSFDLEKVHGENRMTNVQVIRP